MGFDINQKLLYFIHKERQFTTLYKGNDTTLFIKDELKANKTHGLVVLAEKKDKYTLQIDNPQNISLLLIPVDGKGAMFSKSPPVSNPSLFEYVVTSDKGSEVKMAGPCDSLLVGNDFHFFEFKTEAFDKDLTPDTTFNPKQAEQHREKAEKQLARTITFFKEQATQRNINLDSYFYAVIVTLPTFPRTSANLFNRNIRFNLQFQADLIEINTDNPYTIS